MKICFLDEVGRFRVIPAGTDGRQPEITTREPDIIDEIDRNAWSDRFLKTGTPYELCEQT